MQIRDLFGEIQPSLVSYLESGDAQLVCKFTGASAGTVDRWNKGTSPANGSYAIKLWLFLEAAGFEIPGLRTPDYCRYLSNLFAYSIITMDEAMQYAGVKRSQTALQIMRGQPPMHPEVSLEELRSSYEDELQVAKRDLQQKLRVLGEDILPPLPEASAEELAETPAFDVLVPVLAAMVRGVLPLVQLAVESWTPVQRSHLRELVGEEMFELANNTHNLSKVLSALNSERARVRYNEGK